MMMNKTLLSSSLRAPIERAESGQALIEFAILLILMVTLIVGGAELAITAFRASKTNDTAKAGANEWVKKIENFGLSEGILAASVGASTGQNFQINLETQREQVNIDTDLGDSYDSDNNFISDQTCGSLPENSTGSDTDSCTYDIDANGHDIADIDAVASSADADFIRPFLPVGCDISTIPSNYSDQFSSNLPIDITTCDRDEALHAINLSLLINNDDGDDTNDLFPFTTFRELDIYQDFEEVCVSANNSDGIEKIVSCRPLLDGTDLYDLDSDADGFEDSCADGVSTTCPNSVDDNGTGIDDQDATFRRLLVLKEQSVNIPIGDHNPARVDADSGDGIDETFRRPSCNTTVSGVAVDYDDGLPQDGQTYLFNPLPIDVTSCNGLYSIDKLIDGDASSNYNGLPQLNRSMYSQYERVCVTENSGVITLVSCSNPTAGSMVWMKPPGKMCGSGSNPLTEYCPGMGNLNGATGYFFFGDANTGGSFEYLPSQFATPYFRPAFQLVCSGASHRDDDFDSDSDSNGNSVATCSGASNSGLGIFSLQVHVRYRSVFESFITFGSQTLPSAYTGLVDYFYNPYKAGVTGSSAIVGALGGEIGPPGSGGRPSVKQFKDFRGCYQVDVADVGQEVETVVSSCN